MMIRQGLMAYLIQDKHVTLVRILRVVGEHEVARSDRICLHNVNEVPCDKRHAHLESGLGSVSKHGQREAEWPRSFTNWYGQVE